MFPNGMYRLFHAEYETEYALVEDGYARTPCKVQDADPVSALVAQGYIITPVQMFDGLELEKVVEKLQKEAYALGYQAGLSERNQDG